MTHNPDRHHRRSIRLAGYDYSRSGAYFVTFCTHNRECLFGQVEGKAVRLTEYGQIAQDEWTRTPAIRSEVELDEFMVMPNHIHGIIWIHDHPRPDNPPVGAHGRAPGINRANSGQTPPPPDGSVPDSGGAHGRAPLFRKPKSLGSLIAGYKSAAKTRINALRGTPGIPVWQRNYHDRIIRNDAELNRIRQYIRDNPARWAEDENHPANWE